MSATKPEPGSAEERAEKRLREYHEMDVEQRRIEEQARHRREEARAEGQRIEAEAQRLAEKMFRDELVRRRAEQILGEQYR